MKKISILVFLIFFIAACDQEIDYTQNTWDGKILSPKNNCKSLPEHDEEIAKMSVGEKSNAWLNCMFPPPPLGRWHAVYTADFAKKYNLSPENISDDFSAGVQYMEMEVVPNPNADYDSRVCFAKILVKHPHDVSYLTDPDRFSVSALPDDFKFSHYFDFQHIRNELKPLILVSFSSRDFKFNKRGFMQTTRGLYLENIMNGYDYIVARHSCRKFPMEYEYFPDGHSFRLGRASVLGRYERDSNELIEKKKSKDVDIYQFIHIPEEIISTLYKDINFRGK